MDGSGHVYVADLGNSRIVKFDSTGRFLAQFGSQGAGEGQFKQPLGVAVDGSGQVYVADYGNHRVQVFFPSGSYLPYSFQTGAYALTATCHGQANGQGEKGPALTVNFRVINSLSVASFTLVNAATGQAIQPLQEGDVLDLTTLSDQLSVRANTDPEQVGSVVFDLNGQLGFRVENFAPYALASNTPDDRYVPYNFQEGEYVLSATSYPQANGQGSKGQSLTVHFLVQARVLRPKVASFTLIDATTGADIQPLQEGDVLDLPKLPAQLSVRANTSPAEVGSVVLGLNGQSNYRVENYWPYALASNQADDRVFLLSQFRSEGNALAVDRSGNLFVADNHSHRIQKFDSVGHFLLQFGSEGSGEGQFNGPGKIAVHGSGNLYVADYGRIQKFDSQGHFLSRFGSEGSGEGQFNGPRGLAVDGRGQLYVVDVTYTDDGAWGYYRYRIQQFDSTGHFLQQFISGDFYGIQDVAVDDRGNVYVAESYVMRQPGVHYVSKFDFSGHLLVNFGGDFLFYEPVRVSVDGKGNVYVGDYGNGPTRIYEFDSSGSTLLQFTTQEDDGHGPFNFPTYVAGDGRGNVYVADAGNHRVQKFSKSGSYVPYAFQVGEYARVHFKKTILRKVQKYYLSLKLL